MVEFVSGLLSDSGVPDSGVLDSGVLDSGVLGPFPVTGFGPWY